MNHLNVQYNGYLITTDKALMFPDDVHLWLSTASYWARHIPKETFKAAFDNSFAIGAVLEGKQVAYARLVTDYATFAYLADVYVADSHRGKGISKMMMQELFALDWVKGLRRIMLATKDAHELYKQVGFTATKFPERIMEITRPNIYGDMETIC